MPAPPVIVWFRRDLRLADNPAVYEAAMAGRPVLPVYVHETDQPRKPGGAARWWLHHSLKALARQLAVLGAALILRRGRAVDMLLDVAASTGARTIFWNRRYDPGEMAIDEAVTRILVQRGLRVETFNASLLFEPERVANRGGQPFQVFAAFWRHCQSLGEPCRPLPQPVRLLTHPRPPGSTVDDLRLLPRHPDWSCGLATAWTPGEDAANARLADFLEDGLNRYARDRDLPDQDGTSRLSPHLAFGEIGPHQIWHAARAHGARPDGGFLRELGWREYCHHSLHHDPEFTDQPQRREFRTFPWAADEELWPAFTAGRTGYPMVDAGMRALWETGWLHNRLRMIVASFLVKDLLMPWQRGAAWFWDTLVDADAASNAGGWQWVAGCGSEAAPFFRIFNPVLQGEKFDPEGRYVRRWVPELNDLPDAFVHRPWQAPAAILARAGIVLGDTYPQPIVEHDTARRRALLAYEQVRRAA